MEQPNNSTGSPDSFVMVPRWLIDAQPGSAALLAYVSLASFGRFDRQAGCYVQCSPAVNTLAERMGVAPATAKRGVAELVKRGAIGRTRQFTEKGEPLPSIYRVFVQQTGPEQQKLTSELTPLPRTGATPPLSSKSSLVIRRVSSPVSHNQERTFTTPDPEKIKPPLTPPKTEPSRTRRERPKRGEDSKNQNRSECGALRARGLLAHQERRITSLLSSQGINNPCAYISKLDRNARDGNAESKMRLDELIHGATAAERDMQSRTSQRAAPPVAPTEVGAQARANIRATLSRRNRAHR